MNNDEKKEYLTNEIDIKCNTNEAMLDFGYFETEVIAMPKFCLYFNSTFKNQIINLCLDHYYEIGLQSLFEKDGEEWLSLMLEDSQLFRKDVLDILPDFDKKEVLDFFEKYKFSETSILISFPMKEEK